MEGLESEDGPDGLMVEDSEPIEHGFGDGPCFTAPQEGVDDIGEVDCSLGVTGDVFIFEEGAVGTHECLGFGESGFDFCIISEVVGDE